MSKDTWPLSNPAYATHHSAHVPFSELTGPIQFVAEGLIALGSLVTGVVVRMIDQARRMRRINNTIDALAELDDRALRDIGLSRDQIPLIAMHAEDTLHKNPRGRAGV